MLDRWPVQLSVAYLVSVGSKPVHQDLWSDRSKHRRFHIAEGIWNRQRAHPLARPARPRGHYRQHFRTQSLRQDLRNLRSEVRRVGKARFSSCRSRWATHTHKKNDKTYTRLSPPFQKNSTKY